MRTLQLPHECHHGRHERGSTGLVRSTFREIATVLAEREGESISPADVRQICRTAETKLADALRFELSTSGAPYTEHTSDASPRTRNRRDDAADIRRRSL
jgi:hypothetical protein